MLLFKRIRAGLLAFSLTALVPAMVPAVQIAQAAPAAQAAPTAKNPVSPAKDVETRITADKLTYTADKQQAVFETNVHVVRPDMQLWSDRLIVHLKPAGAKSEAKPQGGLPESMGGGDLDKLVADGNVRMSAEGGRTGTCARATYTADDAVLRMTGDPRVSDKENTVTGEEIIYYTRENRSEVRGGKKRVEAVFSSPAKTPREARTQGGR